MKEQIKEILKKFAGDNIAISEKDFDELSVEISEELSLAPSVTDDEEVKMKKLLIKWLDKLIYGWADTMPAERKDDPSAWDSMQKELKELQKLRAWIINNG